MKITQFIKSRIFKIKRNHVILDRDIALLYNIETEVFRQAIKANVRRFPKNGMLQLTKG
ncbi:MAG: ORF6N domain-containing protein [Agriterribacter sp.]